MTQDRLTRHDLSLTFDNTGRLWKFRPTDALHGHQPVDAGIVDDTIVVTVAIPGIAPGDVDLHGNGDVLGIRGKTDRTMDLACDVALPMAFGLDQIETVYADEALAIRVLPPDEARTKDALAGMRTRDQLHTSTPVLA
jgi:HSP20 family molecular chaperone IbpA